MKQSRRTVNETIEGLAARDKAFCLQGEFGRAAKILSSDGVAPENIQTFRGLKTLHPLDEPRLQFEDYSSQAHQFDEPTVFGQIEAFLNFSAASPSKMYPEHLLPAVLCSASDQSKQAITSIKNLVNLASRDELRFSGTSFLQRFFSASFSCGRCLATFRCKMHIQTNNRRRPNCYRLKN